MELRAIQAVQIVKPSETRRTNSVSETWLDVELAAHPSEHKDAQPRRHPEDEQPFEDAEDVEVVEVSDSEADSAAPASGTHVHVIA